MSHHRRPHRKPSRKASSGNGYGWLLLLCAVIFLAVVRFGDALPFIGKTETPETPQATQNFGGGFIGNKPSNQQLAQNADFTCRVQRVVDGDTLRCQDGTRIRLHAISARERDNSCSQGHPCARASAEASTAHLRRLVQGKRLSCQTTGDSYERIAAICWTPDYTEVNCNMVKTGNAALWPRFHREMPICRATPDAL